MPGQSCPRCGAASDAASVRCSACGVALPVRMVEPITVGSADTPQGPRGVRLSRLATTPDAAPPAAGRSVRRRHLAPPTVPGGMDYELQAVLGEGGMGVVWSAQQAGLSREVAIKRARPGAGKRAAEQLLAEAELTGSLEHPGIVPVHEVGIDQDGVPFYAMRRLRGRTWAERWGDLDQRAHLDVLLRVGDAVAYAHGQGVIHRDLKPANVFLGEYGEVIVFDWGLATRLADMRKGERLLMASGTPVYMAPEMARADAWLIGPASDVYLLGAMLYEILTGLAPHPGEEVSEIMVAAAENRIEPPIPDGELGEVARRAMAAEPADRFPDVRAFQAALRTCLAHQESVALAARAAARLSEAHRQRGYSGFARAVHAFEDAVELWPQNRSGIAGLSQARLEFAIRARDVGDLDLACGLLSYADPAHGAELARITALRTQRLRRRRALRALAWTSAVLLLALVAALLIGFRAVAHQRDLILTVSRERDAAEAALMREQAGGAAGSQRAWRRVVQEDFGSVSLPPQAKVVAGRWGITAQALVVEGDRPGVLAVPLASTSAVVVQIDLEPGGRLTVLAGDDAGALAQGSAGSGVSVTLDSRLTVHRAGAVLATAPLGEAVSGLARRLRLEIDHGRLRALVDGHEVVAPLPVAGLRLDHIGLTADPGAVLDNLRVDVPVE